MDSTTPLLTGGHLLIASEVELAEKAPEAGVKEEDGAATPGPAKVAKPDGASTPGAAKQVVMRQNAAVCGHSLSRPPSDVGLNPKLLSQKPALCAEAGVLFWIQFCDAQGGRQGAALPAGINQDSGTVSESMLGTHVPEAACSFLETEVLGVVFFRPA